MLAKEWKYCTFVSSSCKLVEFCIFLHYRPYLSFDGPAARTCSWTGFTSQPLLLIGVLHCLMSFSDNYVAQNLKQMICLASKPNHAAVTVAGWTASGWHWNTTTRKHCVTCLYMVLTSITSSNNLATAAMAKPHFALQCPRIAVTSCRSSHSTAPTWSMQTCTATHHCSWPSMQAKCQWSATWSVLAVMSTIATKKERMYFSLPLGLDGKTSLTYFSKPESQLMQSTKMGPHHCC